MKELNEMTMRLEDIRNRKPYWELEDLRTLIDNTNNGQPVFSVSTDDPVAPVITYILAKLLQRIDKLEDEVHELRSRID